MGSIDALMGATAGIPLFAFNAIHGKFLLCAMVVLFGVLPILTSLGCIYYAVTSFMLVTATDRNYMRWLFQTAPMFAFASLLLGGLWNFGGAASGTGLGGMYFYATDQSSFDGIGGSSVEVDTYGTVPFETYAMISNRSENEFAVASSGNCSDALSLSYGSGSKMTLFYTDGSSMADPVFQTLYDTVNTRMSAVPNVAKLLFYISNSFSSVMFTAAQTSQAALVKETLINDMLNRYTKDLFGALTTTSSESFAERLDAVFATTDQFFHASGAPHESYAYDVNQLSFSSLTGGSSTARVEVGKIVPLSDLVKRSWPKSDHMLALSVSNLSKEAFQGDAAPVPLTADLPSLAGGISNSGVTYNSDIAVDAYMKRSLVDSACLVNPERSSRSFPTGQQLQADIATATTGTIDSTAYTDLLSQIFSATGGGFAIMTRSLAENTPTMPSLSAAAGTKLSNTTNPTISDLRGTFTIPSDASPMAPCMKYGDRYYENLGKMYSAASDNVKNADLAYAEKAAAFAKSDSADVYVISVNSVTGASDMTFAAAPFDTGNLASLGSAIRHLLEPLGNSIDGASGTVSLQQTLTGSTATVSAIDNQQLSENQSSAFQGKIDSLSGMLKQIPAAAGAGGIAALAAGSGMGGSLLSGGLSMIFALLMSVPFMGILLSFVSTFYTGIAASALGLIFYPIWVFLKAGRQTVQPSGDTYGTVSTFPVVELIGIPVLLCLEMCAVAAIYNFTLQFFNNFLQNLLAIAVANLASYKSAIQQTTLMAGDADSVLSTYVAALKPFGMILTVSSIPLAVAAIIRGEAHHTEAAAIGPEMIRQATPADLSKPISKLMGGLMGKRGSSGLPGTGGASGSAGGQTSGGTSPGGRSTTFGGKLKTMFGR